MAKLNIHSIIPRPILGTEWGSDAKLVGSTTAAFSITTGLIEIGTKLNITFPTAKNGWIVNYICPSLNLSSADFRQVSFTPSTVTFELQSSWNSIIPAGTVLLFTAISY